MKRLIILIMCATLLCVGCSATVEEQAIQQESTTQEVPANPVYSKGLHSYQITYSDGSSSFLYHDGNNFVTGCITPSGEVWNVFAWDRSYPQNIYQYWIDKSPELANSFRDNYNSMISCFDTDAKQCEIYVAQ